MKVLLFVHRKNNVISLKLPPFFLFVRHKISPAKAAVYHTDHIHPQAATSNYTLSECVLHTKKTMSVFIYLQHAEAGSLDISSAVHIALHKVYAIFSQTRQQDALQISRLLHLIG